MVTPLIKAGNVELQSGIAAQETQESPADPNVAVLYVYRVLPVPRILS